MGERKIFLDWLRVLAFATLILFHVGMLYVTWGYNLKSPRLYPSVEWWMESTSPWRMPLLFVISGVACRFLIGKLQPGRFALNRLARLGVVVLTAMLIVNPVQAWVQLIAQGDTTKTYLDFWFTSYLTSDRSLIQQLGRPMPTWDHVWFIVYLLPYTLLFAGGYALLRNRDASRWPLWMAFTLPAIWMAFTNVVIATQAPITHALVNDGGAHLKWFGLFLIGAILAHREDFWAATRRMRLAIGLVAITLLAVYLTARATLFQADNGLSSTVFFRIAEGFFGWTAVLAIIGFAYEYLDRRSAALRYLNEAILPVYVLHQPIMLAAAYLLFALQLPIGVEVLALVAITALGSLALFHVAIRPWRPMRFLFGLKSVENRATQPLAA